MENLTNMASPDDEAGVRLVGNDEINGHKTSKDKNIEVKYMTPESQNGDAKIDIGNLKTAFAGMGKEELMKYANDPFWVKMRWFLFVLFWLIWIAMLAGAIAIIVLAPKCSAPSPRDWWEQSPLYEVDVRSFKDGSDPQDGIGDLKGLESKLDYLEDLGVKTIVVSNILKSDDFTFIPGNEDSDSGNTVDFKQINEQIGTLEDFRSLTKAMKEKGLNMLMSFIPNHSSYKHSWFLKSVEGVEPYKDYYIWAPPKGYNPADGKTPLPPNNWLSKKGGSAWEWNENRKMFYLHQFDKSQPDFNFYNQNVVDHFKDVMKFWLANGVSGFHLDKVQYLLEDRELRNESMSGKPGNIHDEYEFYNHQFTSDLGDLSGILKQWNEISANSSGILSVTSLNPPFNKGTSTVPQPSTDGDVKDIAVGQLFVRPQLLPTVLTANSLKEVVDSTMKSSNWPTWEFVCKTGVECIKKEVLPGLQVVSLLLPGTPVTRSGSELGIINSGIMPWNNSTNGGFTTAPSTWRPVNGDYSERNVAAQLSNEGSQLHLYKHLLTSTRHTPAIMHGSVNVTVLNETVFTFTRIKAGNPGFLVAFNINSNSTIVNLTQLKGVPPEISIVARTPSLAVNSTLGPDLSVNKEADVVYIDGYTALVIQFVPAEEK